MWKLLCRDHKGLFMTWEIGETCAEAFAMRSTRYGSECIGVIADRDGNPISTIEPEKFDRWGEVSEDYVAWRKANWHDDGSAR